MKKLLEKCVAIAHQEVPEKVAEALASVCAIIFVLFLLQAYLATLPQ